MVRSRHARGALEACLRCGRGVLPVGSPVRFQFGAVLKLFTGRYCILV